MVPRLSIIEGSTVQYTYMYMYTHTHTHTQHRHSLTHYLTHRVIDSRLHPLYRLQAIYPQSGNRVHRHSWAWSINTPGNAPSTGAIAKEKKSSFYCFSNLLGYRIPARQSPAKKRTHSNCPERWARWNAKNHQEISPPPC